MKGVREWDYGAVIGVGGVSREPVSLEINEKVNWVGIGPIRLGKARDGYCIIAFERFYLRDADGPDFYELAPKIAKQFFGRKARRMIVNSEDVKDVLALAKRSKSSPGLSKRTVAMARKRCEPSKQMC